MQKVTMPHISNPKNVQTPDVGFTYISTPFTEIVNQNSDTKV